MMQPKVIILCGAGASKGSGGLNKLPPLGGELFQEFPKSWGSVPLGLSIYFDGHFEDGMEKILASGKYDIGILQKDMAIYFSKFVINDFNKNLYFNIINNYPHYFDSYEMIFATINYDCLIEEAGLKLSMEPAYFRDDARLRILKIHGSCNFILNQITGTNVGLRGRVPFIEAPIRPIHPSRVEKAMKTLAFPPAMTLYSKGKDIIVCPNQLHDIAKEFQNAVSKARLIVIIGIKPNPSDTHIWDPLGKTNARLVMVGNKNECEKWIKNYRGNLNDQWVSDRFSTAINDIYAHIDRTI